MYTCPDWEAMIEPVVPIADRHAAMLPVIEAVRISAGEPVTRKLPVVLKTAPVGSAPGTSTKKGDPITSGVPA